MSARTVIMVGGPANGRVLDVNTLSALEMPESLGDSLAIVRYRDSGHMVDGAHVFVIEPGWKPRPFVWEEARHLWYQVFYAAVQHGGDPKVSPLVKAFHNAWRSHYPKRIPNGVRVPDLTSVGYTHKDATAAGCGGHGSVWPCADARAMAKPLMPIPPVGEWL